MCEKEKCKPELSPKLTDLLEIGIEENKELLKKLSDNNELVDVALLGLEKNAELIKRLDDK